MNNRGIYIFDIDGTLANIEHRLHHLSNTENPERWKTFYSDCLGDSPIQSVISVMEALRKDHQILLFTARTEAVRELTVNWLHMHTTFGFAELMPHTGTLTMRENGDYTPDHILKRMWLKSMLEVDRNRILGVFDDRQSVVDMWRSNGLKCFQVEPGKF